MGKARPTIPPLPREGGSYVLDAKAGRWEKQPAADEPTPAPLTEAQDDAAHV